MNIRFVLLIWEQKNRTSFFSNLQFYYNYQSVSKFCKIWPTQILRAENISQDVVYLTEVYGFIFLFTDQEDRTRSVNQFRNREKDVLVATDVASKGLDFPDIQHVINYDMPEDIENYGTLTWQRMPNSSNNKFWNKLMQILPKYTYYDPYQSE